MNFIRTGDLLFVAIVVCQLEKEQWKVQTYDLGEHWSILPEIGINGYIVLRIVCGSGWAKDKRLMFLIPPPSLAPCELRLLLDLDIDSNSCHFVFNSLLRLATSLRRGDRIVIGRGLVLDSSKVESVPAL
jgi:hypothetical protein